MYFRFSYYIYYGYVKLETCAYQKSMTYIPAKIHVPPLIKTAGHFVKELHIFPHKIQLMQELKPMDYDECLIKY